VLKDCLKDPRPEVLCAVSTLLIDLLHSIMKDPFLQKMFVKLIPVMITNLGNKVSGVRKLTHRCIASYVKLSQKLEMVLLVLSEVGLASENHRCRQHSMLVVPALLSLKPQLIGEKHRSVVNLMESVTYKLKDDAPIV